MNIFVKAQQLPMQIDKPDRYILYGTGQVTLLLVSCCKDTKGIRRKTDLPVLLLVSQPSSYFLQSSCRGKGRPADGIQTVVCK